MEQDDEEFEKLLGEIPRATSAPPHAEEFQRAKHGLIGEEGGGDAGHALSLTKVAGREPELYSLFSSQASPSPPFLTSVEIRQTGLQQNVDVKMTHGHQMQPAIIGGNLTKLLSHEEPLLLPFTNMKLCDDSLAPIDKDNIGGDSNLEYIASCGTSNGEFRPIMHLDSSAVACSQRSPSMREVSITACLPRIPYYSPLCHETSLSETDFMVHCSVGRPDKPHTCGQNADVIRHEQSRSNTLCDRLSNGGYPSEMLHFPQEQGGITSTMIDNASLCYPSDVNALPDGGTQFIPNLGPTSPFLAPQFRTQQQLGDRHRMQQALFLRQHHLQEQHARFHACMQGLPGPKDTVAYKMIPCDAPITSHLPRPTLITAGLPSNKDWKHCCPGELLPVFGSPAALCHYFTQGFCSRGEICPFTHSSDSHGPDDSASLADDHACNTYLQSQKTTIQKGPRNVQAPQLAVLAGSSRIHHAHMPSDGVHFLVQNNADVAFQNIWRDESVHPRERYCHNGKQQQPSPKYSKLEQVEGHIYAVAKDQYGCRFLQRKCEERSIEDVHKIFLEVINHIVELMTDPFGNYLVQKLLEVCDESQRREILYRVTENNQLVIISLNMHGTRAVQKLIETLSCPEHITMVISSLRHGVVTLIKDLNGNHVIQRCLQHLKYEDIQFIFDAAASHCVDIATHRHGCCVLQRCVDYSSGQQREQLLAEIASNALGLSQDPFGNYVVQYVLDLGLAWATKQVIKCLDGHYAHLATQKFSSNVVEKCLKRADDEIKGHVIQELISSSQIAQFLQDPFANYVIQSALTVSKGALHSGLVDAIRPHLSRLRSSPYGKRILSRTNMKK